MIDLIEHNPMFKQPILTLLHLCEEQRITDRAALESAALEAWDEKWTYSPHVVIDVLVRNGAVTEQVLVNGEPYEGSFEDIQLDESVPDDAEAEARLDVTEIGRELMEGYAPEVTLAALFADRPRYRDHFEAAIKACAVEGGASRMDVEAAINALPQAYSDPETCRKKVYPQYFIDSLETAGGIAWDGAWHATEAGKAVLAGN